MSERHWPHAIWLCALGALAALAGLACVTLVILLCTDPTTRPDSDLDWFAYSNLLLPLALGLGFAGVSVAFRLYQEALGKPRRDRRPGVE